MHTDDWSPRVMRHALHRIDCAHRIVVTLAVDAGQNGTEEVHATLDRVVDQTGGQSTGELELETPLRLSLSKTDAIVRYPLTYRRTFNSAPREVVTLHGLGGCEDGDLATEPSCGWVVDSTGSRVADSQGFCCSCQFDQILGISSSSTRSATLSCDLFGDAQSAHCLRMDPLWYAAFELEPPQLYFTITVKVTKVGAIGDGDTVSDDVTSLVLGPQSPGASTADGAVTARLLGDFASYTEEQPDLGATKMLFVPSQPTSHSRYQAGTASWLLVDKNEVTIDGTECNKVGTSYSAFKHQSSRCDNVAGSCLGNQLEDMQLADEQRMRNGGRPQRRVSAFGDFAPYADSSGRQYVAFTTRSRRASVVTLTLAADDIRFVIAESSGRIESVLVRSFEAQSGDGELHALVTNTGRMNADYSLRIECSRGILGMEARQLSLTPSEQRSVKFAVYTESEAAAAYTCLVRLVGEARQTLLDEKRVNFTTTARIDDKGAQGGVPVSRIGRSEEGDESLLLLNDPCDLFCTKFYDISCFLLYGCTAKLWTFVLVLVGSLLCCCTCCRAARSGACGPWARFMCGGSASSRDQRRRGPRDDEMRHRETRHRETGRYAEPRHHFRTGQARPAPYEPQNLRTIWKRREAMNVARGGEGRRPQREGQLGSAASTLVASDTGCMRAAAPLRVHQRRPDDGRHLPRVRSSFQKLTARQLVVHHPHTHHERRTVYLNLSEQQAWMSTWKHATFLSTSRLQSPGPEYSLRGELVLSTSSDPYFSLGDNAYQHWRWSSSQEQHVRLPSCIELNRAFFRLPLYNQDGSEKVEMLRLVSSTPAHPCINSADRPRTAP